MVTLDQFLWAERQQESGGNYSAHNSIGALGAYQVMPANLPSWTKKALGHSVSQQEFLTHPAEQDAVARTILGGYFKKYGPEGAAASWYSGQPNPNKTYGHPPVRTYVNQVMARLGGAPKGSGSSSTPSITVPASSSTSSSVVPASMRQAGYTADQALSVWGVPVNPFDWPGWFLTESGKALGEGAQQAVGSAIPWDALSKVVLSSLIVLGGVGLVIGGGIITVWPTVKSETQKVGALAGAAAEKGAV